MNSAKKTPYRSPRTPVGKKQPAAEPRCADGKRIAPKPPTNDRRVVAVGENNRVLYDELAESTMKTLGKCGEDDPAIIFEWHDAALQAVIAAISPGGAARPAWVTLPVTVTSFKVNLLQHVATIRVRQCPLVNTMGIMPLTLQEYSEVKDKIRDCLFEPSLVAAYTAAAPPLGPIATVYFVYDGARPANAHRASIALAPQNAVQVFE
jgi:hypothetical protein